MREMINGQEDMTKLAHRGSYKTTCLSIAFAILMCTHQRENIIFIRKSDEDVAEITRQVKGILECDAMQYITEKVFDTPIRIIRNNANEITTDAYASPRGGAQLLGIGTGGSITGKHADIISTDDIVNAKDRASRAERERIKLIYQELQNIKNRGGRIINTGTPWHKEDAISLMPNVQKYDCYKTGMITDVQLAALRRSMSPSLFAANYELVHIATENALFSTPPTFASDEAVLRDGIAHIDASYGGEDGTALTLGKRDGDTLYMLGKLWQGHVDNRLVDIAELCNKYRCAPIHCEENADKGYLGKDLRQRGLTTKTYHELTNKYVKISTYLRKWWPNIIWLDGTDPEYINQIMDYTQDAQHDDAPDSASCIARLLDKPKRQGLLNL
jgi:hypothetical protein